MDDSFDAFLSDFPMPHRFTAALFGVSARTWRRWRQRRRLPRHAQPMVKVMRANRAPWQHRPERGPYQIEYSWRSQLYGAAWKDWESPDEIAQRRAWLKQLAEAEAARREETRQRRSECMRRAWRRRGY